MPTKYFAAAFIARFSNHPISACTDFYLTSRYPVICFILTLRTISKIVVHRVNNTDSPLLRTMKTLAVDWYSFECDFAFELVENGMKLHANWFDVEHAFWFSSK